MPCYELAPQGFKGLQGFSITLNQRFLRRKFNLDSIVPRGVQGNCLEVIDGIEKIGCDWPSLG